MFSLRHGLSVRFYKLRIRTDEPHSFQFRGHLLKLCFRKFICEPSQGEWKTPAFFQMESRNSSINLSFVRFLATRLKMFSEPPSTTTPLPSSVVKKGSIA